MRWLLRAACAVLCVLALLYASIHQFFIDGIQAHLRAPSSAAAPSRADLGKRLEHCRSCQRWGMAGIVMFGIPAVLLAPRRP
jgi:hypothetical protein